MIWTYVCTHLDLTSFLVVLSKPTIESIARIGDDISVKELLVVWHIAPHIPRLLVRECVPGELFISVFLLRAIGQMKESTIADRAFDVDRSPVFLRLLV
jgi:hypothetical protein